MPGRNDVSIVPQSGDGDCGVLDSLYFVQLAMVCIAYDDKHSMQFRATIPAGDGRQPPYF
jgi:hypothetical protein